MAERKLTKSELKMKQRDPKKFAELQKIRARRAKGYKRTLGPKVVKPTKKKKVTRNQRIGGGTMKPGLNAAVKIANKREDKIRPPKKKKPTAVKPTSRKVKPVDPYRYLSDNIDEEELSNKMPEKRKTLGEAMFGGFKTGDFTAKDQMVENPFTGKPMTLEYDFPDSDDMKKGGSIKKKMKKGKVKKRAALRGQGKALRGF